MDEPKIEQVPEKTPMAFTSYDRLLVPFTLTLCFIVVVAFTSDGSVPRLGVTLPLLAAQGTFFWYHGRVRYNRTGLYIMGAGAVLSLSLIANANFSLYGFNLLAMLALTVWGALAATYTGGYDWKRPRGFVSGSFLAIALVFCDLDKPFRAAVGGVKNKKVFKVLLGLLISVPLLLFVTSLLGDADRRFYELYSSLFSNIRADIVTFVIRAFFAFLMAVAMYSFFFGVKSKRTVNGVPLSGADESKGGDGIVFLTVTGLLNAVYAVFVYIQFVYLFGGRVPDGVTYADYARRGFFELTFITLLNLTVILLAVTFTDKERRASRYIRVTGGVMLFFTSVILASAVYRMLLYVGAYGLSIQRFLVLWGELVMLVWIVLCALKLLRPERKVFVPMAAVTLVLYLALNFCNMDYIITAYNLSRPNADTGYLETLSTDTLLAADYYYQSKHSQAYDRSHSFWSWNITDAIVGRNKEKV